MCMLVAGSYGLVADVTSTCWFDTRPKCPRVSILPMVATRGMILTEQDSAGRRSRVGATI